MKSSLSSSNEPLIKIRPRKSWSFTGNGEFWAHRELLYFLIWRDLKVRYKQTALGYLWVILQPLSMTLVFAFFLRLFGHVPSNNIPYSVFAYSGLVAWVFLTNAILSSSYSLIGNANLITKVYFPRIFIPMVTVAVRLVDFIIAVVFLAAMILYYGFAPTWTLLLFPVLILEMTLLALSIGMMTAALNVKYRDVGTVLPVLLQLWMFLSPIIYPASLVPERWQALYMLNPLAGIVENQRAALFGLEFHWTSFFISIVAVMLLLIFSSLFFQRAEESLVDVI